MSADRSSASLAEVMPVILTTDEEHCLDARTMGRSEGGTAGRSLTTF